MKGIAGYPYIDVSKHIDVRSFDKLQSKIFKGIALAKHLAQVGNLELALSNLDLNEYNFKPLIEAYREFNELPNTHTIKLNGMSLSNNQLATYLKYAFGGYDLYVTYHKNLFEQYFPELLEWINQIRIFQSISDAYIMTLDAGGIAFEHHHPPVDDNDISKPSEFVHIRPNLDRPFYVRNSKNNEKYYINTRVAYWHDQDRHGGDVVCKPSYSIRIDGIFTESFRKDIFKND
jgi:hypothetical protein